MIDKMTKVLVTGASGMLGSALCPILKKKYEVFATDVTTEQNVDFLDVRDFRQVMAYIRQVRPRIVFHLSAETDVDRCEVQPDHAYLVNTMGTQNVALACQKYDITMVYISTIGVFDGNKPDPYTEFDTPNPINVYGRSKLEGERVVLSLLRNFFIVRAGWMMGGGPQKDKKFVGKIIRQLNETNTLKVVNDKFGSPTYSADFSNYLIKILESGQYGIYHCTNKGVASRYEVAKRIIEILGRTDVVVEPVSSAYFPLPAPRPRSEASRNYKLDLLGINAIRRWEDALQSYIESYWMKK